MRIKATMAAALLLGGAGPVCAQIYHPSFDPAAYKGPQDGAPNELMILGTPHLSSLPEGFDAVYLDRLIDRLAEWKPQAIAIEVMSGAYCDFIRRDPARYDADVASYCWDPAPAKAATGLDVPAATAEAERLLATWPTAPAAGERRHLAAVFFASGDQYSALVQWLRLAPAERHAGDGLDAVLVERLERLTTRRNEDALIAAPLAARLGLERVYPVDDQTAARPVEDEDAYAAAITTAWNNPASARRKSESAQLEADLGSGEKVIAMYRAYNSPEAQRLAFESDFGAALEEPSAGKFGRRYLGYWETRNLRMAANIRDMFAAAPGIRALVIVGASHKGYLEAYLEQMHDVRLVSTDRVLD